MRVSITSGGTTHHLAGESGISEKVHSSAANIQVSANIATQSRGGVRKASAGVFNRRNLTTTVSFSTSRLFATVALAEAWVLAYDRTFLATGTVTMGTNVMLNAVVLPPTRRVDGCSVFLDYTIIGGAITAAS